MAIFKNSRYTNSYTYTDYNNPNIVFLDPMREIRFFPSKEDLLVEVEEGDRLDIISFNIYGDESLEWVILDVNPQFGSALEIRAGDIIRIPLPEKVSAMLNG